MEREETDRSFEALLAAAGVGPGTLDAAERAALDGQGFVALRDVVDAQRLPDLRRAFDAAAQQGGKQRGTRHFDAPVWDEPAFDLVHDHPRVLAAAFHVLGRPFRALFCGGRDPLPGFGAQGLHTDWLPRAEGEPYAVASVLWLLDDFTPDNGSTRVVPGSQRLPRPLPRALQQPGARHPDARRVLAPAGAVLVFNGHLVHGGTRNDSRGPRRVLHVQFVARELAPPDDAPREVPARLSAIARALLGDARA